jgi:hypothetical protein
MAQPTHLEMRTTASSPHLEMRTTASSPHLATLNGNTYLEVDGKPFLMRAGELGNSSASSIAYMKPIWPKLRQMHLNTVLVPVYWELLEPLEGKFDFRLVDSMISEARAHQLKLVLLWFGTWKNSMSCYAPAWVKTATDRFPRARNTKGITEEIITPFSANALQADKTAFLALMKHLKQTDGIKHTVLMIQVENEIGMLPDARDHSQGAEEAFVRDVPAPLIDYLTSHHPIAPELKNLWEAQGAKTKGTWETVFGSSLATDEAFMAWYFGAYVQEIVKAGKAVYDIPMYVNAALNAIGKQPGAYPSAGPLPHVMDIWKASAPSIDFLSPDFYNPRFRYWNDRYTRSDNPLFIPEHKLEPGVEAKALYAFGHYHAMGFSPFSIESVDKPSDEPIAKVYELMDELSWAIPGSGRADASGNLPIRNQSDASGNLPIRNQSDASGTLSPTTYSDAVLLSRTEDTCSLDMGDYVIHAAHDLTLGWSAQAKDSIWPLGAAIIIAQSQNEFLVAGTGVVLTFQPKAQGLHAGILSMEEGTFDHGVWHSGRRMNGDQDHQGRHLRIPTGEYGIQRIKLYTYP